MNTKVNLYGSLLSANVRKVYALALHLGIDVSLVDTDVYRGAGQQENYQKLNSLGQIPTLVDADVTLQESNAILVYLAERYAKSTMYRDTPSARAKINRWLYWEASQWQPVLAATMEAEVGYVLLPDVFPKPDAPSDWTHSACVRQLEFLERSLNTVWLVGTQPTLADFCVGAMTTYFEVADFPFASYPRIEHWYRCLNDLPAWKETSHTRWA